MISSLHSEPDIALRALNDGIIKVRPVDLRASAESQGNGLDEQIIVGQVNLILLFEDGCQILAERGEGGRIGIVVDIKVGCSEALLHSRRDCFACVKRHRGGRSRSVLLARRWARPGEVFFGMAVYVSFNDPPGAFLKDDAGDVDAQSPGGVWALGLAKIFGCESVTGAPSLSVNKYPIRCPTVTTAEAIGASARIWSLPRSSDSTSIVALSLSSAKNGSPAATWSPSFFNQPAKIPCSMDQPRRGTVISIGIAF